MEERLYTKAEVRKITREAVGLWRCYHNARLYRSAKYFNEWFKKTLSSL